jgi:hypothetical protein
MIKCINCEYCNYKIPESCGSTGWSYCELLKYQDEFYSFIIDLKKDGCTFGKKKVNNKKEKE